MTSRERVLAAFEHRAPDRTPIWEKLIKSPVADDILGRPCAASNHDYRMERLAEGDWEGLMLQTARDEVDLTKVLGFDMIRLYPNPLPPAERPVRVNETTWRTGNVYQERLASGWIRSWVADQKPVPEEEREAATRGSLQEPPPGPGEMDERSFLVLREGRRIIA